MSSTAGIVLALLIGVAGTTTIHLSKGVMKRGMALLRTAGSGGRQGFPVYFAGVLMNFTNPVWVILANRFAPTVYYTSMYGIGLVSLLLFSHLFLREPIDRRGLLGALVVVAGTLIVGAGRLITPVPGMEAATRSLVFFVAAAWGLTALAAGLASRRLSITIQELLFGLFGGGLAALEALLKGVAQSSPDGARLLPQSPANWWVFAISFLGAAGAFGMIQWSYLRRCRVSIMAAAYDVSYVALPMIIVALAIPGGRVGWLSVLGLAVLGIGAFIIQSRGLTAAPASGSFPPVSSARRTAAV